MCVHIAKGETLFLELHKKCVLPLIPVLGAWLDEMTDVGIDCFPLILKFVFEC